MRWLLVQSWMIVQYKQIVLQVISKQKKLYKQIGT